jgi:1,4-dihydroxy-6-naphthoate synthase
MTLKLKEITAAQSPDSDDAFMFYALAQGKLDTGDLKINRIAKDIQTLNQEALKNTYEVTAISFAVYPEIHQHYFLTSCGASMGENYGPVLIARDNLTSEQLESARIAIPGRLTTAFLVLRLFLPNANFVEIPFDEIIEAVANQSVDAGLLIHEGQLTYAAQGLKKLVDLGEWWHSRTKLPLPLGGNAIRKDLGQQTIEKATKLLRDSIVYSLAHRKEALHYAMSFARDMSEDMANRYVGMYVNELTVDCGDRGRRAVKTLFDEAFSKGLLKEPIIPEFAD